MSTLNEIKDAITKNDNFTILSHEYPDGDSIGSSIALSRALKRLGKKVNNIVTGDIPSSFQFLLNSETIKKPNEVFPDENSILIFLDCADQKRIGFNLDIYKGNYKLIINIDHHIDNTNFGDLNYVDSSAAATGVIIYELLNMLELEIDKDISNALYTSIVTDTGNFRFDNTTSYTFAIVSELLKLGANLSTIRINLWESKNHSSVNLLVDVLSTMNFAANKKVGYIVADMSTLNKWNATHGELESYVNYPKSIKGIEIAILFKEISQTQVKVSFRSKNNIDVRKIAHFFGGGGHKRAAGCTIKAPLNEAIQKVIAYLEDKLS